MNRLAIPGALSLLGAALLPTTPAHAQSATYCVGTTQQLQSTLATIDNEHSAEAVSVDLRLRSGTYLLTSVGQDFQALQFRTGFRGGYYRISGGWNSNCTAQSSLAGQASVLDGQGQTGILRVRQREMRGDLTAPPQVPTLRIDNLRFRNGVVLPHPQATGCLAFDVIEGSTASWLRFPYKLLVEHVVFQGCQNAMSIDQPEATTIRNSAFVDNFGQAPAISAFFKEGPIAIINNTFRRNEVIATNVARALVGVGGGDAPMPAKTIANNIFAETVLNGPMAHEIIGDQATWVRRNRVVHVTGYSGFGLPIVLNSTGVDPQFVSQHDLRLAPGSPLRDLGDAGVEVGAYDLGGALRIQGANVDLGAHELGPIVDLPDALFADGFD